MASKKMSPAKTVDEYIASFPTEVQPKLEELRALIQSAAPKAEEVISYGMAGYKYKGSLVYFGGFKEHCSLFGGTGTLTEIFKKELKEYKTSKGTIQFPYNVKLPKKLIKDIVKFRVKENEGKGK